jgi:hypothetical protein
MTEKELLSEILGVCELTVTHLKRVEMLAKSYEEEGEPGLADSCRRNLRDKAVEKLLEFLSSPTTKKIIIQ